MDLQKIVKALYIYGTAFFKILILPNSKYFLFSADPLGGVSLEERKVGVAAPKMFAFDSVFTDQDLQEDVANSALSDIIASVVNGTDGCLFCFGHANLGKSRSMLGSDETSKTLGIIPIAIAWLYRAIKEKKTR